MGLFEVCRQYRLEECLRGSRLAREATCVSCSHQYEDEVCQEFRTRLLLAVIPIEGSLMDNMDGYFDPPMVSEGEEWLTGSGWRLARSLVALRAEANAYAPKRRKSYDGTIGDKAHQARASRHNPNAQNVVCALDLTHDPAGGFDAHAIVRKMTEGGRSPHPDCAYIISNGQVARKSGGWKWGKYSGASLHDKHVHVAVGVGSDSSPRQPYDTESPWGLAPRPEYIPGARTLQLTDPLTEGKDVGWLQARLEALWLSPGPVDGKFGTNTRNALMLFQRRTWPGHPKWWHGTADANTWRELKASPTAAEFIDAVIHKSHPDSPITGDMVWACRQWFRIYPVHTLAIWGHETSQGDPHQSPLMVANNNFGCVKALGHWEETPWGKLATTTFEVESQPGVEWLSWPTPWDGAAGWGRLMKLNYLDLLNGPGGLKAAYSKYYGPTVPGHDDHLAQTLELEDAYLQKLLAYTKGITS